MVTPAQAAAQLRQQIDQFTTLSDDEWTKLVPHLTVVSLKKQQAFAQQGLVADRIGMVLDGALRQFYTKDGDERTTYFFFRTPAYRGLHELCHGSSVAGYHRSPHANYLR